MVQGGVPPMRPDQALQPVSRSGTGPAPQSPVVVAREVLISGAGGGLFVYNAARTQLLESIAGAATIDPVTGTSVPAGTATYNTFGRVISLLSTTNDAFFQYANVGAAQGQLIASLSSSSGVDPVAGFGYNAGLYGLDAVGGNITTAGPVISLDLIPFTRVGQIRPGPAPAGSTPPSIQLDAPEDTQASHLQMFMTGESPNAVQPAQLLLGVVSGGGLLSPKTGSTIETQASAATQSSLSGVQPSLPANSLGLDIRISGDGAARAALTAGFTGAGAGTSAGDGTHGHDVFLLRNAASQWITSLLTAIQPGTASTAETFHAFTGANSWAQTAGAPVWGYQLLPDGSVQISGNVTVPVGGMVANQAMATAIPAAYRPANPSVLLVAFDVGAGGTKAIPLWCYMSTSGVLTTGVTLPAGTAAGDVIAFQTQAYRLT